MRAADQFHGHGAIGDVDQLVGLVDNLSRLFLKNLFGKELDHGHGNTAKHLPQRTDRGADAVFLDHRNGAVGDTRALGELTLGKTFQFTDRLQSFTDVQCISLPGFRLCG
ncbi:hypothetical protein D3C72_1755210 [compost metagenome]